MSKLIISPKKQLWIQQWGARVYTRFDNWYHPSTSYGMGYYNWFSGNLTNLPTSHADSYNPMIVIPKECTLKEYNFTGNFTSSQTYEVALMKGTGVTYGSAGNYVMSQIGSTQSAVAISGVLYTLGEEGLSINLRKGDMLLPCVRRTTTDTSSYYYFEQSFSIVCEVT